MRQIKTALPRKIAGARASATVRCGFTSDETADETADDAARDTADDTARDTTD